MRRERTERVREEGEKEEEFRFWSRFLLLVVPLHVEYFPVIIQYGRFSFIVVVGSCVLASLKLLPSFSFRGGTRSIILFWPSIMFLCGLLAGKGQRGTFFVGAAGLNLSLRFAVPARSLDLVVRKDF